MPWVYHQRTGELWLDGALLGDGYSGHGFGKNNPALQKVKNVGPIPQGDYLIGNAFTDPERGTVVMPVTPKLGTDTWGRYGFLIHGDSVLNPGQASDGCIILGPDLRLQISSSDDRDIEVVT